MRTDWVKWKIFIFNPFSVPLYVCPSLEKISSTRIVLSFPQGLNSKPLLTGHGKNKKIFTIDHKMNCLAMINDRKCLYEKVEESYENQEGQFALINNVFYFWLDDPMKPRRKWRSLSDQQDKPAYCVKSDSFYFTHHGVLKVGKFV